MEDKQPMGVISIGSNDIHLLVAASDGIGSRRGRRRSSLALQGDLPLLPGLQE